MITYWPSEQSLQLNYKVANLFLQTHKKFSEDLSNSTKENLPIDLVDTTARKKLFASVLSELEILVLDIIELNLNIENLHLLNHKILYDIIEKSLLRFISSLEYPSEFSFNLYKSYYFKLLLFDHRLLLENLLIYLIFGSSGIDIKLFPFEKWKTPLEHVKILLENLVIQISNIIVVSIIDEIKPISKVLDFLIINKLCNSTYISIRSIAVFRNNLIAQSIIILYFYQPKAVYSARYKVWLFSSQGLISRYIYTSRSNDYLKLCKIQLFCILCLELQDLIIPKLESLILVLGRIILYLFVNILGNSLRFLIRTIFSILSHSK
uniref:Ycf55 n=1 Tax=Ahnfeltia plicata TaxID=28023 RepID=A0A1C9CB52_9FLOR|nr:hypothetical protein Ahnf_121 [Ahnfeltia plicata]AOM65606.1 hypothetical protein Ahnf_121 [Ahnfeltia plicata]UAT97153.1 hypothetical protein Ahn.pli.UK.pt_075 [Ahnfeltia plicata]UAT97358.1 hypothetical protein Ahn.pli.Chile.pt_075 [Ahnfeltia plicata]